MRVNKEWNHKYLSGIESITNRHLISPLQNIPKKYNFSFWKNIIAWVLVGGVLSSFGFATLNHLYESWVCEWFSNLFLNLALGMTASLIILLYTNRKEQNINFYEQNLQLLKDRHDKLRTAYYASFGSIMKNLSYRKMDEATEDAFNSFECFFCVINFFEFLFANFAEVPKPLNEITNEQIEQAKKESLELYREMQAKAGKGNTLSEEDLTRVQNNGDIVYSLLGKFKLWIDITENGLYGTKYGNEKNNSIGGDIE